MIKRIKLLQLFIQDGEEPAKKILEQTLLKLKNEFNSKSANLICYIGPSISLKNYEVKRDVAENFDENSLIQKKEDIFWI